MLEVVDKINEIHQTTMKWQEKEKRWREAGRVILKEQTVFPNQFLLIVAHDIGLVSQYYASEVKKDNSRISIIDCR